MARKFQPMTDSLHRTDEALQKVVNTWNAYKMKRDTYATARERYETLTRKPWGEVTESEFVRLRDTVQHTYDEHISAREEYKKAYFYYKTTNRTLIQNKQL